MCDPIINELNKNAVLFINHRVTKVAHTKGILKQIFIKDNQTGNEQILDADLLIVATGCKPNVTLAEHAGCKIGKTGGIIVNQKAETTIDHVYAVGDCTEYNDFITNQPLSSGLGSTAVRQGITAGINAAGGNYQLPNGFLQTRTSEFFDKEIAAVGPTKDQLQAIPTASGRFKGSSLPEYFPGGQPITIKLIAHKKTGCILAAQAVGHNAAQRINTCACAILNGMTVEQLRHLETAYAPPIAPTLDAITLVCDIVARKLAHRPG
jgi:NADH oxidase (H2O2-forming)